MARNAAIRTCRLADPAATAALGRHLAGELLPPGVSLPPPILLLQGDLGAGKTSLVQGLAQGLGIGEPVTSPTFALAQHYGGSRLGEATALVHLDLYRLDLPAAADELFTQEEEEARSLGALLAVEWPERLGLALEEAWRVELAVAGEGRVARIIPPPAPR